MEILSNRSEQNVEDIISNARKNAVELGYEPYYGIIIHLLEEQLQIYNREKRSISNPDRRLTVSALKKVKSEHHKSKEADGLLKELGYNNTAWEKMSW